MNIKKKYLPFIILFIIFNIVSAQDKKETPIFNIIKLKVKHSKRIPYNDFVVSFDNNIYKKKVGIDVRIKSNPLDDSKEWKYSKIDTSFVIKKEVYNEISDSISNLNFKKILPNLKGFAIDGYSCTLEFGGYNNRISTTINSPSPYGEYTESFYNICFLIIKKIGLKPYEILERPVRQ